MDGVIVAQVTSIKEVGLPTSCGPIDSFFPLMTPAGYAHQVFAVSSRYFAGA
jgi:hypothetical protein